MRSVLDIACHVGGGLHACAVSAAACKTLFLLPIVRGTGVTLLNCACASGRTCLSTAGLRRRLVQCCRCLPRP